MIIFSVSIQVKFDDTTWVIRNDTWNSHLPTMQEPKENKRQKPSNGKQSTAHETKDSLTRVSGITIIRCAHYRKTTRPNN